jgi:hypothetical protein
MRAAWLLLLLMWVPAAPVQAESLRCHGHGVSDGDSRLSVLYKCGEPVLKDGFCAPLLLPGRVSTRPVVVVPTGQGCQPVEEWLYDRGVGHLMAVVRFQNGVVQSIRYGHVPR